MRGREIYSYTDCFLGLLATSAPYYNNTRLTAPLSLPPPCIRGLNEAGQERAQNKEQEVGAGSKMEPLAEHINVVDSYLWIMPFRPFGLIGMLS